MASFSHQLSLAGGVFSNLPGGPTAGEEACLAMLLPQGYRDLVEAVDLPLVVSFLTKLFLAGGVFSNLPGGGPTAGGGGMLGNASATGLS